MATPTEYYEHQPLPTPRSIRVLRLQPDVRKDAKLVCRLEPVSLDESPQYWALSYAWDEQAPSHRVLCQDDDTVRTLKITANCAAALCHLRDADEERTLWVDSICINQKSVEERNKQVALMGDVYLGAEKVVVWLGESDPKTDEAMDLLRKIGNTDLVRSLGPEYGEADGSVVVVDEEYLRNMEQRRKQTVPLFQNNARELTKEVKSEADDKLGPFFRRSWFRRMWTVQEVILPQNDKVEIRCGDTSMPWQTLWVAADVLGAIEYQWGDWEPAMKLLNVCALMMIRHRNQWAKEIMDHVPGINLELPLTQIMVRTRSRLATDPKDKAYALYGLFNVLNIALPKPDYTKTLGTIYAEITAAVIERDKSLMALFSVPSDSRRAGLPSWVPDWSDKAWNLLDPRYPMGGDRFAASSSADPQWKFTPNPLELIVYGKVIDTIIYRTDSYPWTLPGANLHLIQIGADGQITATDALRSLHRVYKTMKDWVDVAYWTDSYPTGEHIDDALKATLLHDYPENHADVTGDQFHEWLKLMRAAESELPVPISPTLLASSHRELGILKTIAGTIERVEHFVDNILGTSQPTQPSLAEGLQEEMWRGVHSGLPIELRTLSATTKSTGFRFHQLAMRFSMQNAFFRTDEGYFGLAPDRFPGAFQSDDVIALIAGLASPVVLRKVGDSFHLVSHCYVHGMMYGQMWDRIEGQIEELSLI